MEGRSFIKATALAAAATYARLSLSEEKSSELDIQNSFSYEHRPKSLGQARSSKDIPAYVYNDLKREHLMRTGSVVNHEMYLKTLKNTGPTITCMEL